MLDIALLVERYGRVGSIEKILPEFTVSASDDGGREACWPSAVGMIRISSIESLSSGMEASPDMLSSIMMVRDDKGAPIDITEFHGVMLFRPVEGNKWHEQLTLLKSRPTLFEVVPLTRVEAGRDYAFFARRASRVARQKRRSL